ncbi:putative 39S ribosomal protein L11 [Triplophysa rosa]|uniref:Large ribosomal subunit protein uL11 n=1 Tax=Triplophysa rosa TaxID=992332 RepID=A0A9W7WK82_TRIRA|nr:putative 39S ribosomal protein L11 [Triplophysa rosa]
MSKITKAAKAVKRLDTGSVIRAIVRSGQAAPGPPLGPILGQPDRTYDLKIGQPTVSYFLKQAAGIEKGAGKTGKPALLQPGHRWSYILHCILQQSIWHETAGMVSVKAVYEIAQVKSQDESFKLQDASMQTVVKSIIGSARSLGIKVVNDLSPEEYREFLQERQERLRAEAEAAAAAEAAMGKKK